MEDDHSKDSKASSDEASSAEPTHDDAGSRRPYYECTFCKRGFSNAQALGGHMNIHRKDRSRARPPPPSALERADGDMEGYRYCSQYPGNYSAFYPPVSGPSRSYNMYFPASASSGREAVRTAAMDNSGSLQMPYEQCLFGEELRLGLSSTHGDASSAAVGGERRQEVEGDELDLELRLGHQP